MTDVFYRVFNHYGSECGKLLLFSCEKTNKKAAHLSYKEEGGAYTVTRYIRVNGYRLSCPVLHICVCHYCCEIKKKGGWKNTVRHDRTSIGKAPQERKQIGMKNNRNRNCSSRHAHPTASSRRGGPYHPAVLRKKSGSAFSLNRISPRRRCKAVGHKNKKSLGQQVSDALQSKLRIGESKHEHKKADDDHKYIFSWNTYRAYQKHAVYFVKWAKEKYRCKTVDDCRQYADEWIQARIDAGLSAYTIKLEVAALCKLYGDTAFDYIKTPPRLRKDIKRSRGRAVRDANFSEITHEDLVEFCRSTGLRRSELRALTGDKLIIDDNGDYRILVNKMSKGGRQREALIVGNVERIVCMMKAAGNGKVFDKIPVGADIHGYRAEYATAIYQKFARDPKEIRDRHEVYCCRKDRRKTWYDRRAMLICSQNLGHNRVCVVGEHYLKI